MEFTDVDRARIELLRKQPFFANLIIHLPMVYDKDIPYSAGTDGEKIYYNDEFLSFPPLTMEGVICHEALHCALLHHWRQGGRNQANWNVACDYSINPIVLKAGMSLPKGALVNYDWAGDNAERIYDRLPKRKGKGGSGQGKGTGQGKGYGTGSGGEGSEGNGKSSEDGDWFCGGTQLAKNTDPAKAKHLEQNWKYRLAKAVTAVGRGNLPGGMEELVGELLYPEVPMELLFRRLITSVSGRGDYRLTPPNKKHLWRGLLLPSTTSDYIELNACVDVSGSISKDEIKLFLGMIDRVAHEHHDFNVHIFIGDTEVNQEVNFTPFTQMVNAVMGRGGTDFRPFFDRIKERHLDRLPAIFLTDLDGYCPDEYAGEAYWLVPKNRYNDHLAKQIKFGTIVKINTGGKDA